MYFDANNGSLCKQFSCFVRFTHSYSPLNCNRTLQNYRTRQPFGQYLPGGTQSCPASVIHQQLGAVLATNAPILMQSALLGRSSAVLLSSSHHFPRAIIRFSFLKSTTMTILSRLDMGDVCFILGTLDSKLITILSSCTWLAMLPKSPRSICAYHMCSRPCS